MRHPQPPRQAGYSSNARLEGDARARFDILAATMGLTRVARFLGVGEATISRLRNGGCASRKVVERVTARLGDVQ